MTRKQVREVLHPAMALDQREEQIAHFPDNAAQNAQNQVHIPRGQQRTRIPRHEVCHNANQNRREQRADYAANRAGNRLVRANGGAEFRPLDRLADPHCKRVCHAGNANHECYQGDLQRFRLNVCERNRAHAGQGNRQHRQHTQHGVIQLRFGAENDADHRHQADGHNDRQNHFRADKQRQRN